MLNKCAYLCRQGNTRPQECRSSHSPARRTLPWSRRRFHLGTDRASTGPCGTPLPLKTPCHYGCTLERLGRGTKKKNKQMLSSLNRAPCGYAKTSQVADRSEHSVRRPSHLLTINRIIFSSLITNVTLLLWENFRTVYNQSQSPKYSFVSCYWWKCLSEPNGGEVDTKAHGLEWHLSDNEAKSMRANSTGIYQVLQRYWKLQSKRKQQWVFGRMVTLWAGDRWHESLPRPAFPKSIQASLRAVLLLPWNNEPSYDTS